MSDVVQNKHGDVEKLIVQKGVFFKKKLDIPADRIQSVEHNGNEENAPGKVTIDVSKKEAAALTATHCLPYRNWKQPQDYAQRAVQPVNKHWPGSGGPGNVYSSHLPILWAGDRTGGIGHSEFLLLHFVGVSSGDT